MQEQAPDQLGDLVDAAFLQLVVNVVRLEVERADHAEHDREDATDENVEEVVDARAAAPQPVEALQVEPDRDDHRDERQDVRGTCSKGG